MATGGRSVTGVHGSVIGKSFKDSSLTGEERAWKCNRSTALWFTRMFFCSSEVVYKLNSQPVC